MAQELQCPSCGTRHSLKSHADEVSFSCSSCGRLLRVPTSVRTAPRSGSPDGGTVVDAGGATSVLPVQDAASQPARRRAGRPLRILAWVAALLLGGFLTFFGARAVGYLSGNRALDLVLNEGIRRYTVLLPLVPIWAAITTVLVTVFLDGRRAWRKRRGAQPSRRSAKVAAKKASGYQPIESDPVPPPRSTEGRRAGGQRSGRAEV